LTGTTGSGSDSLQVWTEYEIDNLPPQPSLLNLQQYWNQVEFNIFGINNSAEAVFNNGSTVVVVIYVNDGTTNVPSCMIGGFTKESNNLTLSQPCCPIKSGVIFTESIPRGAPSMCACPTNATFDPESIECVCNTPGQVVINGQCKIPPPPINACGGTGVLGAAPGTPCGQSCVMLSCNGPNALMCKTHTAVCGGCSAVPTAAGEGSQPGETCTCPNGTQSRFYCTGSKELSCDCQP